MQAVIILLNEKGGVGKTTTASNLAAGLARYGFRVLLADMDSQGHIAARFGLKSEDAAYLALSQKQDWRTLLRGIPNEVYGNSENNPTLWILPGWGQTRNLINDFTVAQALKFIKEVSPHFDFLIFDTSPQIGAIHTALMVASDYLILPTECTRLSVQGLNSTIDRNCSPPQNVAEKEDRC